MDWPRNRRLSRYGVNFVGTIKVKGNIGTATGRHYGHNLTGPSRYLLDSLTLANDKT